MKILYNRLSIGSVSMNSDVYSHNLLYCFASEYATSTHYVKSLEY